MSPTPKQFVEISDFPGLVTNADGSEVPSGSADRQTNFMSNRVGELTHRPGLSPDCIFEDE